MQKLTISPEELEEKDGRLDPLLTQRCCGALEDGRIIYFPQVPFELSQGDIDFLLRQEQTEAAYHKNISYRPLENRIRGLSSKSAHDRQQLTRIMATFSQCCVALLKRLLVPYAANWRLDYASFRPKQERGRALKLKARNDLLHVDAFPTRPTAGDRILRFFININPREPRHWITSEPFHELIENWAGGDLFPLPGARETIGGRLKRSLCHWANRAGLPVAARTRYDEFMLAFHDYLKESERFQRDCSKFEWRFSPGSAWMVFTDQVPHAALAGQYALEQTLLISRHSLLNADKAPVNVLERIAGATLTT